MAVPALALRTNVQSIKAQKNLMHTERGLTTSMGRLSSGLRINQAADDAAGLAISEKLRSHIRGLSQASRNCNDGISMLQTAEGALGEVNGLLNRMRELSVQSANGTLGTTERTALNSEFSLLRSEIDRISNTTEFAGKKLVDGSQSAGVTFQVGIMNTSNDQIKIAVSSSKAADISVTSGLSLASATGARAALDNLDSAIKEVTTMRGDIGATQNRLYVSINNLATMHENLSAANSRIRDTDVAEESAAFTRSQILMQAGTSILAQANQLPQMALSLIG